MASSVGLAVDDLLKAPIGDQPGLAQRVAQLPNAAQRVGLTQLLWADCQRRAEANQVLGFDRYWSEFRDPAIEAELRGLASAGNTERAIGRQVRQVILAAGNQPGMLAKTACE